MLQVIKETGKSMPQFQGPSYLKVWTWAKFPSMLEKIKKATLINTSLERIFWNENISCHGTFNWHGFPFQINLYH